MLLAELVALSERLEQQKASSTDAQNVPSGYQMQPIKAFIQLDLQGNFVGVTFTSGQDGKKKDLGQSFAAPHMMRAAAIKPRLLADNGEYAIGLAKNEADSKVALRHQAFVQTLQDCFDSTQNLHVEAILKYLHSFSLDELKVQLTDAYQPDLNLSFEVDGQKPFEFPDIQHFWKTRVMGDESTPSENATSDSEGLRSLISGKTGKIMEREPIKIKGIPDGQVAGMNFISANAGAFVSYGLEASQIAPVLVQEAEQYANALNSLLKDSNHHLRLGGMVYVFWTKEGDTPPVSQWLSQPRESLGGFFDDLLTQQVTFKAKSRPEQIRDLFKSVFSGIRKNASLESTDFYAAGLSASGSRVVVRHHIKTSLAEFLGTISHYFAAQTITSEGSKGLEVHGVYSLIASMYRDARKEMTRFDADHLLAFAFRGETLPYTFLQRAVQRNRAEKRITHPRAALLKMTLISRGRLNMGELEHLEENHPEPAYQLGRLLAVLDDIQNAVMRANTTLVDRYYGSLSTTPGSVLGRLVQGTQHHLSKLRKDNPGIYTLKQRQLESIMVHLKPGQVPKVLNLEEQSLFSLGYYHQRAQISQTIQEKVAQRKEKAQNSQNSQMDDKESDHE